MFDTEYLVDYAILLSQNMKIESIAHIKEDNIVKIVH